MLVNERSYTKNHQKVTKSLRALPLRPKALCLATFSASWQWSTTLLHCPQDLQRAFDRPSAVTACRIARRVAEGADQGRAAWIPDGSDSPRSFGRTRQRRTSVSARLCRGRR